MLITKENIVETVFNIDFKDAMRTTDYLSNFSSVNNTNNDFKLKNFKNVLKITEEDEGNTER